MGSVAEARSLLQLSIGLVEPGTPLKAIFGQFSRRIGVTPRRIETIWQGTARRIDAAEMDRLRALAAVRTNQPELVHATQYDAIAARLEQIDSELHRASIDQYRGVARALRDVVSARGAAT
jgi:hypothetical protein